MEFQKTTYATFIIAENMLPTITELINAFLPLNNLRPKVGPKILASESIAVNNDTDIE